jgi:hypothetical protein
MHYFISFSLRLEDEKEYKLKTILAQMKMPALSRACITPSPCSLRLEDKEEYRLNTILSQIKMLALPLACITSSPIEKLRDGS